MSGIELRQEMASQTFASQAFHIPIRAATPVKTAGAGKACDTRDFVEHCRAQRDDARGTQR
ncbi:hypothetical protein [Paraburkholderia sp. GAS32]|uniref:hypothetical protein n=1 Tax=Paraburkholderia sp. GAS32 TaxID=3035129 RepID=UPI003D22B528